MHQDCPGDRQFPVRKPFAAQRLAKKDVFDDANATFGLGSAPLQPLEFPGTAALFELPGTPRTDCIVDPVGCQSDAVDFIIESPVGAHGLELLRVSFLHASNTAR